MQGNLDSGIGKFLLIESGIWEIFFWNPDSRALQFEIQLMGIFMFFFQRNSCPLFLNHFLSSSSFSVINVRIDIKNYIDKDSTLFMFVSLQKSG